MPGWVAGVVVGRDVALVGGSVAFRAAAFGWRWPGAAAFFRTSDVPQAAAGGAATAPADAGAGAAAGPGAAGVGFMKPLLLSKANTVLQLVLLGAYLLRGVAAEAGGAGGVAGVEGLAGWAAAAAPGEAVAALEVAVAATTLASAVAYARLAASGRLFK